MNMARAFEVAEHIARDATCAQGEFGQRVLATIPYLTELTDEIERLRAIVRDACEVLRRYDLPEHAFHYERVLAGKVPLTIEQKVDPKERADGA
jgi:hypothetical protein